MLGKIANPITFCLQVLLTPTTDANAKRAACSILIDRVNCTTYADFSVQVARPEITFTHILQLLAEAEAVESPSSLICKALVRLICRIAAAYWVENQCFEHFVCRLSFAGAGTFSKTMSLQILSEMISEIMLLVSLCQNDGELEDESQIGKQSEH